VKRSAVVDSTGRRVILYVRATTGRTVPCPGAAHLNPHVDHCLVCAPRWGIVDELAPVDLAVARSKGLAVPIVDLSEEQAEQARALGGTITDVTETWRRVTHMFRAFIWETRPTKNSEDVVKSCACGLGFTMDEWLALPDAKLAKWPWGEIYETRRCPCGSHLTLSLAESVLDLDH